MALALGGARMSVAGAQPAGGMDDLRARMDEGQSLFLAGKYNEAASVFEAGYARYPYSAFLYNAGVCHQKAGSADVALARFQTYLEKDPTAPDAADVKERVAKLEAALAAARAAAEAARAEAAASGTGGATTAPVAPTVVDVPDAGGMKSLVVVETEPAGAPVRIFQRKDEAAPPFDATAKEHPGWVEIAQRVSPVSLTLDVGRYHVVVDPYRDFNLSETDINVAPGHVHQFKANLSQGEFLGFLRVSSNVIGARVYLDDDGSRKLVWGTSPHGELTKPGLRKILVEAPGYEPGKQEIEIVAGEQYDVAVSLARVGYGIVRIDATAPEVVVSSGDAELGRWKKGDNALEIQLPVGQKELVFTSPGYKELREFVDVPAGQILPLRAKMHEKYPRTKAWVQAVMAAGFIGAGIYLGVESDRMHDSLSADRALGYLSPADSQIDRGMWYSIGADASFALGGILGAFAVYNFVRDPYPDSELRKGRRLEFSPPPDAAAPPAVAATSPKAAPASPAPASTVVPSTVAPPAAPASSAATGGAQ